MVTIAAIGDIHLAEDLRGCFREPWSELADRADLLLLAGDLTQHGSATEAQVLVDDLDVVDVPVVAVLGNHDYHSGEQRAITRMLREQGVSVLEGESIVIDTAEGAVGVAGVKGFCLGFSGRCAADFGEPEMKAFTRHGKDAADSLRGALDELTARELVATVALTHFAPIDATLVGEPKEIWPFLGNYLLGEAIDSSGADLAIHGHAHAGFERGETSGGVPVRNVAQPVLRTAYGLYAVGPGVDAEAGR